MHPTCCPSRRSWTQTLRGLSTDLCHRTRTSCFCDGACCRRANSQRGEYAFPPPAYVHVHCAHSEATTAACATLSPLLQRHGDFNGHASVGCGSAFESDTLEAETCDGESRLPVSTQLKQKTKTKTTCGQPRPKLTQIRARPPPPRLNIKKLSNDPCHFFVVRDLPLSINVKTGGGGGLTRYLG